MPLTEDLITAVVERHEREYDRYAKLAEFIASRCQQLVDANALRATVSWRAKEPDRLRDKLRRKSRDCEAAEGDDQAWQPWRNVADEDGVFALLNDLAGVRVATYVETDREAVVNLIRRDFSGPMEDRTVDVDRKDSERNLYRATHCQVVMEETELVGRYKNLRGLSCEVQVCSLLAHVYNEVEHDLRYKPLTGELSESEQQLLDALGHLTLSGDKVVGEVLKAAAVRQQQRTGPFEDVHDFVTRLRNRFPTAERFSENVGQLLEECRALDLESVEAIEHELLTADYEARAAELAEQLQQHVELEDGRLSVDPDSSDLLLVLLLEQHAQEIWDRHPSGRGIGGPPRIASLAKRFLEMRQAAAERGDN